MRQLDSIWQEQQVFLPRLTLDTEAPSKATSQMVIKIRNKRRPAVFDADPQAAARAIQASFGVKDMQASACFGYRSCHVCGIHKLKGSKRQALAYKRQALAHQQCHARPASAS